MAIYYCFFAIQKDALLYLRHFNRKEDTTNADKHLLQHA